MTPDEFAKEDATGLLALVDGAEVKPDELISTAIEATRRCNPDLNFVASLEETHAGVSPSACIPTFIKDIGSHVQGLPFWNGCKLFDGLRTPNDSNFGRMLKDARCVALGVATAPEFSLEGHCHSVLFGKTRNPWDKDRSPGGSSGGSAVAVATGCVPVAHASDIAGSIRVPAAWCGVIGLKPSRGRGSTGPAREEAGFGLANNFVLTRTVRDTALFLDKLSRHFPGDPFEVPVPEAGFTQGLHTLGAEKLKIAMILPDAPADPEPKEVGAAVQAVAAELEDQGHVIVPVAKAEAAPDPDAIISLVKVWHAGFADQMDQVARRVGRQVNGDTMGTTALAAYELSKTIDLATFFAAKEHIYAVRRQAAAALGNFDLCLSPTSAQLPPKWDAVAPITDDQSLVDHAVEKMFPTFEFTFMHNLCGTPAMSLPLGQSVTGLPIGIQLSAKFGREDVLLSVAKHLEETPLWMRC